MASEGAKETMGELIHVDFRRRCRADALPDDPVDIEFTKVTCKNCPLKEQCFLLVKIFKRRLCPFYPFN